MMYAHERAMHYSPRRLRRMLAEHAHKARKRARYAASARRAEISEFRRPRRKTHTRRSR